jgi:hypothetical protein
MNRVSVIFTAHREYGLANVAGLQAILERIRPEVIFLEMAPASLDRCLQGVEFTLESAAALRYGAAHPVRLVAVDPFVPSMDQYRAIDYLFRRIDDANPEIPELESKHCEYTSAYGFPYLNSAESAALRSMIDRATKDTLEELAEPELVQLFQEWTKIHDAREAAMLRNIEEYSERQHFQTAAFLVGSAHRWSILEKIRERSADAGAVVHWQTDVLWEQHP